jgi:hypothetical protein
MGQDQCRRGATSGSIPKMPSPAPNHNHEGTAKTPRFQRVGQQRILLRSCMRYVQGVAGPFQSLRQRRPVAICLSVGGSVMACSTNKVRGPVGCRCRGGNRRLVSDGAGPVLRLSKDLEWDHCTHMLPQYSVTETAIFWAPFSRCRHLQRNRK